MKKIATNDTTVFVYDASGKLIVEVAPQVKENIYAGSRLLAEEESSGISYLTNDTLGSPRLITNANGVVVSRRDFMPYGEEIQRPNQGTDIVRQKFTGYERDNETELDFAQARMYQNKLGRFTNPDPLLSSGRIENPQTWNRFAYVLGNPLRYSDPLGLFEWDDTLKDDPNQSVEENARRKSYREKILASIASAKQKAQAAFDAGKISQKKLDKINNVYS